MVYHEEHVTPNPLYLYEIIAIVDINYFVQDDLYIVLYDINIWNYIQIFHSILVFSNVGVHIRKREIICSSDKFRFCQVKICSFSFNFARFKCFKPTRTFDSIPTTSNKTMKISLIQIKHTYLYTNNMLVLLYHLESLISNEFLFRR